MPKNSGDRRQEQGKGVFLKPEMGQDGHVLRCKEKEKPPLRTMDLNIHPSAFFEGKDSLALGIMLRGKGLLADDGIF